MMASLRLPCLKEKGVSRRTFLPVTKDRKGYTRFTVFIDITYGVHDRDQIIVVRDPDGTLRQASPDRRVRLDQIYFPLEGRKAARCRGVQAWRCGAARA